MWIRNRILSYPILTMNKVKWIDQFGKFLEVKRSARKEAERNKPKGPIDIKEARAIYIERNKKNRRPT